MLHATLIDCVLACMCSGLADSAPREPFYYRPELAARGRANAAKYGWAKALLEQKLTAARRWAGWTDERLLDYVPTVTPMRPCDCPNCGNYWREYIWQWSADQPNEIICRVCNRATTSQRFPDDDVFVCKDPQGVDQQLPFHRGEQGKRHFVRSRLAYHKICHAAKIAVTLSEAYVLTGEERFARKALLLMRRMGEVYPGYVLKDWTKFGQKPWGLAGKISGWHYEDATAVGALARAYDALRCAGVVNGDDAKVIEAGLFRKAGELLIGVPPARGCVNDIPHRFAGVASIARVLDAPDIMAWVLNDRTGFVSFVQEHWLPDGHWCERSPSYDLMALSQLHVTPMVMLGYKPSPDSAPIDWRRIPRIQTINTALFDIAWPNGTLPAISDSHVDTRPRKELAEINYAWYGGEDRLALLARAYEGRLLEAGDEFAFWRRRPDIDVELKKLTARARAARPSVHLPHLGITMLAAGADADRTVALLDHGKWADGHSHYDRLSIILWGCEREMASDLGYVYAAHPLRGPWTSQTLAHNTVVVDGESQARPGKGQVVFCRRDGAAQVIEARALAAYPRKAAEYRRTIALLASPASKPLLVDIFRIRGGSTHDWSYHAETNDLELDGLSLSTGGTLGTKGPYQQLADVREGETDEPWSATYRWPDGAGLRLWMAGAAGTRVHVTNAPGQRRKDEEGRRLPYLVVRRSGQDLASTFVCVHEPFRNHPTTTSVDVIRCDPQSAEWPVVLKLTAGKRSWRLASKLDENPWSGLPPGFGSLPPGRFAAEWD